MRSIKVFFLVVVMVCAGIVWADSAKDILDAAGVKGGLIVHLGCGDGKLTADLRQDDGFLVHGLDRDPANVAKARKSLRQSACYGVVSVDRLVGNRLPYVDNLVRLVVAEKLGGISMTEVMRVLCPGGVAYIKTGKAWTKTVKPQPDEIDEWTHFLYDATNNAVSKDTVVGPVSRLQWVASPEWARSHDHLATVSSVVSSGGRIFFIVDEGPTAAVVLEPRWRLVARDAYSGVLLWKRPLARWQYHLRGFRSGPSDLARRLVAVGERVYVTLEIDGAVSQLDAATGQVIRTYEQTKGAMEFVCDRGRLFVVVAKEQRKNRGAEAQEQKSRPGFVSVYSQRPDYLEQPPAKGIAVVDAESADVLWTRADETTKELMPTTLAVSRGQVYFQNADEVVCLDAGSGKDVWRAKRPSSRRRPTWSAPTLVVYNDVVLSGDRAAAERTDHTADGRIVEWFVSSRGGQAPVGELIAFSAKDGKRLWSSKCRECYNSPVDVLVAGGLVWTGNIVKGSDPGVTQGLDPLTGQVMRTRPRDQTYFLTGMGHQRCYRNKATEKYLLFGRSGVEFIDVATGEAIANHWIRGTCQYGIMPSNGLLYAPPHSCACFTTSKLNGFNCLAPRAQASLGKVENAGQRLERGPAYAAMKDKPLENHPAQDWPTYRHDAARSGYTTAKVSGRLEHKWKQNLGGRLSSVVVGGGRMYVAQIDSHTVHALNAANGQRIWSYTAGGRVDSPPTLNGPRVMFGSADGWVYCLRDTDGVLVWRFRAAPQEQRIVSYGQLESAWPVPGSVLVRDGVVYCAAGRSSYLDGGIRLCRLDIKTGELLSETTIDDRDPETGVQRKDVIRGTNMPGALPDILSCDGESVYLRHRRFDTAGQPQPAGDAHLYSPAGFLDDTWWHRTYWLVGTSVGTNYGGWPHAGNRSPAGRVLVTDGTNVYGFGRNWYIHHGAHVGIDGATVYHYRPATDAQRRFTYYQLFSIGSPPATGAKPKKGGAAKRGKQYRWTKRMDVLVRAMVLAGDVLFVAGPPDLFATETPAAALEGDMGGVLYAISADEGAEIGRYELESSPVFDGMAAGGGGLYMATTDGCVLCFGQAE